MDHKRARLKGCKRCLARQCLTETVWKRAGGRRHFNAVRRLPAAQAPARRRQMLFEKRVPINLKAKRFLPWGIQKEIAQRLGVSEGTVSRDVKAITARTSLPGLPAAKAMAPPKRTGRPSSAPSEAIIQRKDIPTARWLKRPGSSVEMHALNNAAETITRRQWRERTQSICHRAYRLFVAT